MKKQSMNSKTFWEHDYVLKTAIQRKKIAFLVHKQKEVNSTILSKIKKMFWKIF